MTYEIWHMKCDMWHFSAAILVAKLADLGFTIVDCEAALKRSNDQLENAALWLTENAKPIHRGGSKTLINISGFEVVHP